MLSLMDSHSPTHPEVLRLLVRNSGTKVSDPNYLVNISDSLRESFAPWYEQLNSFSFEKMLKIQHAILTRGLDGNRPYFATAIESPLKSGNMGIFRHERPGLFRSPYLQFSLEDHFTGESIPNALRAFLSQYPSGIHRLVPVFGFAPHHEPEGNLMVRRGDSGLLKGIYRFRYPGSHSSALYIEELALIMEKIRSVPRDPSNRAWLDLLADYVQLFAVGLPFERANFSIAMVQANYILMHHGLRGIEHASLDLAAVMAPTPVFREIFKEAVMSAQANDQIKQQ